MKNIPNAQYRLLIDDGSTTPATTAALLRLTLNQAPACGFDFATMRVRNRIADAAERAAPGGEIVLEDADYAAARSCVEAYRWGSAHPDLLAFAVQFGL